MEDDPPQASLKIVKRSVQVDALSLGKRLDHAAEERGAVQARPDRDRPLAEAAPGIGYQDRGVGSVLRSQPLANRAPAQRAVEREVVGRKLFEAAPAAVARAVLAVAIDVPVGLLGVVSHIRHMDHALAQVEGRFHRVGQARAG